MGLSPYPSYRDSRVDWLGAIPAHWNVRRFKHLAQVASGQVDPRKEPYASQILIAPNHVVSGTGRLRDLQTAHEQGADSGKYQVRAGQVVYSKIRPYLRKAAIAPFDCLCSADMYPITPKPSLISAEFLLRVLLSPTSTRFVVDASLRARMPKVNREALGELWLAFPSLDEQRAIAAFLDAMDARISRFIAARKKMIRLLEEKKQAVINQAVTKGLDPTVPMKDSGVDWLGEIPAHWDVTRLKFVTTHIVDCLHATPVYSDSGAYPAIRTADVVPGQILLEQARRVDTDVYEVWTSRLKPERGDILYSREGERYGIAAPVPPDVDLCISQRMMVVRCDPSVDEQFVMWQLNARHVYAQASNDAIGAAAPHVNVATITNYFLVLPPLQEQAEIAQLIECEAKRLGSTMDRARREVELMQEYRTRLISDVVTGKLDVRGGPR